jgi:hypothetical protein
MELVVVCIVAFLTVMTLLSILASVIRLLTRFFPDQAARPARVVDAATIAAIQAAIHQAMPGGRLVRVELESAE